MSPPVWSLTAKGLAAVSLYNRLFGSTRQPKRAHAAEEGDAEGSPKRARGD